jgi:hypothetical protein
MYFIAVRFSDEKIARLFDLARIILQPDFARPSHITLRGPYRNKSNISPAIIGKDVGKITIRRPGNFFSENQNTVFLGIDIFGIADFWFKPDYPDGTPHLTIYDGKNREFAWAVLSALKRYKWGMRLNSTPMRVLDLKNPLETEYLVEYEALQETFRLLGNTVPSAETIKSMSYLDRIVFLNRICSLIQELSRPSLSLK